MADIRRIKVGTASCGLAAGAADVLDAFKRLAGNTPVVEVGCIGHCYAEPMVEVELNDGTSVFYSSVKGDDKSVNSILALSEEGRFQIPAERAALEKLNVTRLSGRIDPKDIEEYKANGGFTALKKAFELKPEGVIEAMKKSGLRGRGGIRTVCSTTRDDDRQRQRQNNTERAGRFCFYVCGHSFVL